MKLSLKFPDGWIHRGLTILDQEVTNHVSLDFAIFQDVVFWPHPLTFYEGMYTSLPSHVAFETG
jgi:hypothetical protein